MRTSVIDPRRELARIAAFANMSLGAGSFATLEHPSWSTTPGVQYQSQRSRLTVDRSWLSNPERRRMVSILKDFGLETLYGNDGLPRLGPDETLALLTTRPVAI